ncbi:DUF2163 domain-containing protein [Mesorhizobium sp. RP14(2022)]|uniref:DUF2163 domain-containing protein n=1 Tax=Mesorhizobium liriopis TaxID=2953882 RepID=A0ABT1C841_9HYPH|nr:DUF2163 domain-containing protein [Mesorhizobium liriopis]MCO6050833.1 DUF2163 domain-containing protein [Mesorhizobium liriopis]
MPLDSATKAQIETGKIARLDLIRFDLPGKSVGYHRGGRPYTYNGLVYLPNRWLSAGNMASALGVAVTTRTITFSNIPVSNPDDAIAAIELYNYVNAPVIITHLAGDPETDQVLGVLASSLYEIDQVRYEKGAMAANGERSLNMRIDLEPPGRSARGSTLVKCSQEEQQFDNSAADTCLEYASTNASIPEEWGQRSG